MTEWLISSAVWSAGGLVVGYVLGRIEADLDQLRRREERRNP